MDDATAYVNLEAFGVFAIEANEADMNSLLTRIVTGLSGAPWSDLVEVRIADEITGCHDLTERVTRIDLADEAERLTALSAHTARTVLAAGATSLAALRMRTVEPPDGISVVIADPDSANIKKLIDLARDPATPVVLLIAGRCDGVDTIRLSGDSVELPGLHGPVTVDPLPVKTVEAVQALLAQTEEDAVGADEAPYAETRQRPAEAERDAEVEISLLGPVGITGVEPPLPPRIRDLVYYLALHRGGVTTEKVSAALWPDRDPVHVNKSLRNRVFEARRALGGRISTGPHWRLDDSVQTDWDRFQTLAAGGLEEKRQALTLVRGRPLDGIDAEWLTLEGITYEMEATIVDLALEVAQGLLDGDDPTAALAAARAGLRTSPWDERLYRIAMHAAAARQSVGELKNLYKELRVALDLDVDDPMDPETERLYKDLLADACRPAERDCRVHGGTTEQLTDSAAVRDAWRFRAVGFDLVETQLAGARESGERQ
jgi:DNA-binding SARP family transcriptional activator